MAWKNTVSQVSPQLNRKNPISAQLKSLQRDLLLVRKQSVARLHSRKIKDISDIYSTLQTK